MQSLEKKICKFTDFDAMQVFFLLQENQEKEIIFTNILSKNLLALRVIIQ